MTTVQIGRLRGFPALRFARNAGWIFLEKVIRALLLLVTNAFIVRALGYEEFGKYALALIIIGIISMFVSAGFSHSGNAVIINPRGVPDKTSIRAIFLSRACLSLFVVLCLIPLALLDNAWRVVLALSGLLLFPVAETLEFRLNFHSKSLVYVALKSLVLTLGAIAKCVLVHFGHSIEIVALVGSVEGMIFLLALARCTDGMNPRQYKPGTWRRALELTISNRGIWLYSSIVISFNYLDVILLRFFHPSSVMGVYSAATQFVNLFAILPVVLNASVQGRLQALWHYDKLGFDIFFKNYLAASLLMGLILSCSLAALGPIGYTLVYGSAEAAQVSSIFRIYSWVLLPWFFGIVCNVPLIAANRQGFLLLRVVLGMFTVMFVGVILIPRHGAVGAAISFLVGLAIANVFMPLVFDSSIRSLVRSFWSKVSRGQSGFRW